MLCKVRAESLMYKMGVRWVESRKSETNVDEYALNCMVLDFILNISIIRLWDDCA